MSHCPLCESQANCEVHDAPENVETPKDLRTIRAVYRCVDCGQRLPCDCTPENVEKLT